MSMYHSNFLLLLLCNFLCWDVVLCQIFSWKALRVPVGTLSAVCGVHVTPVARVNATESRRSWLYFAGYPFPKNWSGCLLFLLFCGVFCT